MGAARLQLVLSISVSIASASLPAAAGDKAVQIETIPAGAQVEVNGSVTCTTPCAIKVPGYYFGKKRTAFSSHGVEPIRVRLTKQGYVPKSVELTTGPVHWHNLYGNNLYDYYLMTSDHFNFELEEIKDFFPSTTASPAPSMMAGIGSPLSDSTEAVVARVLPAVVAVSTAKGSGSGFFVSPDGVVVTNAHVVQGETTATITMTSGRSVESTALYVDEARDLALIKVSATDSPFLKLNVAPPAVGSDVIAIGTPGAHDITGTLLLPNTVTKGIVSGIRRFPENTTEADPGRTGLWIQTDATINHGNSGGPLLNRSAEVVGINTLAFTGTGTPGLNFALAASELATMLQQRFGVKPGLSAPASERSALVQAVSTAPVENSSASNAVFSFVSNPEGADVEVDGVFLGNTPAQLPLLSGQRRIRISKKGFKVYERTVQVLSGGTQRLAIDLEPE